MRQTALLSDCEGFLSNHRALRGKAGVQVMAFFDRNVTLLVCLFLFHRAALLLIPKYIQVSQGTQVFTSPYS